MLFLLSFSHWRPLMIKRVVVSIQVWWCRIYKRRPHGPWALPHGSLELKAFINVISRTILFPKSNLICLLKFFQGSRRFFKFERFSSLFSAAFDHTPLSTYASQSSRQRQASRRPLDLATRTCKQTMRLTTSSAAPLLLLSSLLPPLVQAGPAAYGICQAGCAAVVMACYGAAGFTWGATLGASAPASIVVCNSAFGTCQAACAAVLLAPTP